MKVRVTKESYLARGNNFECANVFDKQNQTISDYMGWLVESVWERGVPYPCPSDIFGKLGYTSFAERSVYRHSVYHFSKLVF